MNPQSTTTPPASIAHFRISFDCARAMESVRTAQEKLKQSSEKLGIPLNLPQIQVDNDWNTVRHIRKLAAEDLTSFANTVSEDARNAFTELIIAGADPVAKLRFSNPENQESDSALMTFADASIAACDAGLSRMEFSLADDTPDALEASLAAMEAALVQIEMVIENTSRVRRAAAAARKIIAGVE